MFLSLIVPGVNGREECAFVASGKDLADGVERFVEASLVHWSVLRVAENLIHETMHLQLTLFESLCPLVDTESAWSVYSPWKHQERPAQGVLHGLYVFCVLRWIWQRVSQENGDMTAREFALRRVAETEEEIFAAGALEESAALTAAGRHLVRKLLAG